MKKTTLFFLLALTTLSVAGQDISGQWNGVLTVQGTQLRLVFNIFQAEKGYSATMDSPDQGAKGIPVTETKFEDSKLILKVVNAGIEYTGELNGNIILGTFKQGRMSFPLNLSKEKIEKKALVRPQEPLKPYPYVSEDVFFHNKKDNITLAGTLTLPNKEGKYPVVVLISGSGPQDRNEELLGHKPFLVLSDHLTRNGIAVLRYDDRGVAESKGDFNTATSFDFASDVESAIEYLKTRKEINRSKIGLIGHSEGGILAPMVAAKSSEVSFIVLLAGTGIPGNELLLLQQELIGKAMGMSDSALQKTKQINKGAFDIILKNTDTESLKTELASYLKRSLKDLPESGKPAGLTEEDFVKMQVRQLASPWIQTFIRYNPATVLEKVKCPVLAINGEKDLQVPAKINLDAISKGLRKGGNKDVTTKELQNLNHLFQECITGSPAEYATIEQTFSPTALAEISSWIIKQVNQDN